MKIALALSGGGFRATVFHLGVLARLAEENRLEDVVALSSVSGGSLCVGLILAGNNFNWPTSAYYKSTVLPRARRLITTYDLQTGFLRRLLRNPLDIVNTRADDLSQLMQENWGVTAKLSELPDKPRWMINATCFETGKNWRFEKKRMGDYAFGYSDNPDVLVSDAMASSAGFPGLVGPLVFDTQPYNWHTFDNPNLTPQYPVVHLWDGGAYDNLGLEAVFKLRSKANPEFSESDFLVVCDASGRFQEATYQRGIKAIKRLNDIMYSQILALRSRAVIHRFREHGDRGAFLQIGNSCAEVLKGADKEAEIPTKCQGSLSAGEAEEITRFPTVIRKLSESEFDLLFRHGFEVADATFYGFSADLGFNYLGYKNIYPN